MGTQIRSNHRFARANESRCSVAIGKRNGRQLNPIIAISPSPWSWELGRLELLSYTQTVDTEVQRPIRMANLAIVILESLCHWLMFAISKSEITKSSCITSNSLTANDSLTYNSGVPELCVLFDP